LLLLLSPSVGSAKEATPSILAALSAVGFLSHFRLAALSAAKIEAKPSLSCLLSLRSCLLLYIFLSTKGAYYGANYLCLLLCIFLSTKGAYYGANYP
jgi:hypothetical protein